MIGRLNTLAQSVQIEDKDIPTVPKGSLTPENITQGLQIVFGIFGAIALIIITLAGFRYVISQGDPQATAKAKNTILYALVGLGVSIFAFTIVTFVVGRLG